MWFRVAALPFNAFNMVLPRFAGESATMTPALFIASILSPALPLPPEMMAPAWPMRRPGGAVTPAMKPITGFLVLCDFKNAAASSSAVPPISPMMTIHSVSGSSRNNSRQSTKVVPTIGSPPMPTQVD